MKQLIIPLVFLLAACVSEGTKKDAPHHSSNSVVSLCTIAERPEPYVGKSVKIRARHSIVKNYESFFSDANCGKSTISEGSRKHSDRSVNDFHAAGDKICKDRKIESLCSLEADVVVEITIRVDDEGELVADPIHIDSFQYLPSPD
ncbi:MAG TPA: hypothetical protein VJ806_11110 [Luteimonas sp.]|nr:hypothetical protein [Luteimonas sp.]